MTRWPGRIRRKLLGIRAGETSFERRGFRGDHAGMRARLESIGQAFTHGYHAALETTDPADLVPRLDETDAEARGFVYEGAAMALALLDHLTPWRRQRVRSLLQGAGDAHAYMVHVGAGWAMARVPANVDAFLARFDPLLRWLLVDGYGFHEGYFRWPKYVAGAPQPSRLRGYARRAFDQGLGRSLWFVDGGDAQRIPRTIAGLHVDRHGDLWSGVGLASVYAGSVSEDDLRSLRRSAGEYWPHLAQGAAFAAKARQRAGNPTEYTERACRAICDLPPAAAARLTDEALENLTGTEREPAYEVWKQRIRREIARS